MCYHNGLPELVGNFTIDVNHNDFGIMNTHLCESSFTSGT